MYTTTTGETPKVRKIRLILIAPEAPHEYKYKLMSTTDGLTLYFEALDDGSAPDGAIGSGDVLIIPFRNKHALTAYFEKIKADSRTISIEDWKES